jgi:hypothetical protein
MPEHTRRAADPHPQTKRSGASQVSSSGQSTLAALFAATQRTAGNRATAQLARFFAADVMQNFRDTQERWSAARNHMDELDGQIDRAKKNYGWNDDNAALIALQDNTRTKSNNAVGQGTATASEMQSWVMVNDMQGIRGAGGSKGQDLLDYAPGLSMVRRPRPGLGGDHPRGGGEVKNAADLTSALSQIATAWHQTGGSIALKYPGPIEDIVALREGGGHEFKRTYDDKRHNVKEEYNFKIVPPNVPDLRVKRVDVEGNDGVIALGVLGERA